MQRTEIATLGEFGLIDRLTKDIKLTQQTTIKGVGDDAAVIDNTGKQTLITTDLLLEGIHFNLIYSPLKHLGYKAAVVNFSDIYAMNGIPQQITVSLGIDKRMSVEDLETFYSGVNLACEVLWSRSCWWRHNLLSNGFTVSITCIGIADEDKIVYRNGAKETDLIYVSGDLGASYMGLQLLERERAVFDADSGKAFQPDFGGKEYILERQLKPEARKDIVEALAVNNIIPTSMIDISDGLSSDLLHICKQSNVGCHLFEERIPIDYQTAAMAETFNMNVATVALNGGEDYELLFTVPLTLHDKMSNITGVHLVGHITKHENGCYMVTRDGAEIQLKAQGWNPIGE